MRQLKYFLTWVLAAAMAVMPTLSYAGAPRVTPAMVLQMHSSDGFTSYFGSSAELRVKAQAAMLSMGRGVGVAIFTDVFQTAIIMYAAAAAQLTKARLERDQLLAGHKLSTAQVQTASVQAAEDLLCGGSAVKNGVAGEILCSGEFAFGVTGGLIGRLAVQASVMQVLKVLLRNNPTRAALIQLVGTFAASFVMLAGFTMSSFLWMESVRALEDPKAIEQAHGLFGRAAGEIASGNWHGFVQTPDGKLANQVFTNMYNILIGHPEERAAWVYNGWRFGMARGELIVNLTILMGALSAGGALGAAAATAAGLTGFYAGALSFVVMTAIGGVASYASIYLPDLEVGAHLTSAIQNSRAWLSETGHSLARNNLRIALETYDLKRGWNSRLGQTARRRWDNRASYLLPLLRKERESQIGIAFEKYQELRQKLDEAQTIIIVAKEVIANSDLRSAITVNEKGELMSLSEAEKKYCNSDLAICQFPLSLQLTKIEAAKAQIREGEEVLQQLAEKTIATYQADSDLLQEMLDNPNLQFPSELALQVKSEQQTASLARDVLVTDFASLHESIRSKSEVNFNSPEQRRLVQADAKEFIAHAYIRGLDDADIAMRAANMIAKGQ